MSKRLRDYLKCAVFTQRFEHLPDTSLLINQQHLEQAQQLSISRGVTEDGKAKIINLSEFA